MNLYCVLGFAILVLLGAGKVIFNLYHFMEVLWTMIKKTHMLFLPILCFLTFSVQAQETDDSVDVFQKPYFALKGGTARMKLKVDHNDKNYDVGVGGGAIGLSFEHFRFEVELMLYESMKYSFGRTFLKRETGTMLINGFYDFGSADIRPYIGVGLGYGYLADKRRDVALGFYRSMEEEKTAFAAAVHAGVSVKVSDHFVLDAGGRYIYLNSDQSNFDIKAKHSILSGIIALRYSF